MLELLNKAREMRLLIYKYANQTLSAEEKKVLDDFMSESAAHAALVQELSTEEGVKALLEQYELDRQVWDGDRLNLSPEVPMERTIPSRRSYLIAAVVAGLLLAAGSIYYFLPSGSSPKPDSSVTHEHQPDKDPGGRRAVLTLADNSTILLDDAAPGTIAHQGKITINKSDDGSITYVGLGKTVNAGFNTIETPNGGDYSLILEDGSRCTLNAGSKLRYPAAFDGKERKVYLSGEGYFEVVKNTVQPFLVETDKGTVIKVTGTAFNVNTYVNEPTERTSLLSGSVTVVAHKKTMTLRPGQEAVYSPRDQSLRVADANVNAAIFWTKGFFHFNRASLKEVMRQLARWYDVAVELEPGVGDELSIQGGFKRNIPLSEVLSILKRYEPSIEYTIENNKVLVHRKRP